MYALSRLQLPGLLNHDRLGVSLFVSILGHMVLILATAFVVPQLKRANALPTLEITLVQTASMRAPDKAEFLAQVNQDGGGDSDRADIARNPLPVREIGDRRVPLFRSAPQNANRSPREVTDVLSLHSNTKMRARDSKPIKKEERDTPLQLGLMSSEELRSERARLNAEISRSWQEYQQRPRRKFLNARTQEYRYAAYMEAWRAKVERIGNLNYPEEAKRRQVTGSLVVDVVLSNDGTVKEVAVIRPSGHKLLDDAAVRIVKLASPFPAFPPEIRTETDELSITRTWKFNESLTAGEY
jgi:periplasmic protein TonB